MEERDHEKLETLAQRIQRAKAKAGQKPLTRAFGSSGPHKGYGRVGSDFLAAILTFVVLGWLADRVWGIAPWGLLSLTLVGFVVGLVNVWRAMKDAQRDSDEGAQ